MMRITFGRRCSAAARGDIAVAASNVIAKVRRTCIFCPPAIDPLNIVTARSGCTDRIPQSAWLGACLRPASAEICDERLHGGRQGTTAISNEQDGPLQVQARDLEGEQSPGPDLLADREVGEDRDAQALRHGLLHCLVASQLQSDGQLPALTKAG